MAPLLHRAAIKIKLSSEFNACDDNRSFAMWIKFFKIFLRAVILYNNCRIILRQVNLFASTCI